MTGIRKKSCLRRCVFLLVVIVIDVIVAVCRHNDSRKKAILLSRVMQFDLFRQQYPTRIGTIKQFLEFSKSPFLTKTEMNSLKHSLNVPEFEL